MEDEDRPVRNRIEGHGTRAKGIEGHGVGTHGTGTKWILAVVAVVTILAFAPALNGPRVWDDHLLLETNRVISGRIGWLQSLTVAYEPFDTYYRPVTALVLRSLNAVAGGRTWPFHTASLLLHMITAAGVFALCTWVGARPRTASFAVAVFALHPALVEAVAWISGLGDLLSGAALVGSAVLYLRASRDLRAVRWPALVAAHMLFAVAVLSKESALAFTPFLAWIPLLQASDRRHADWKRLAVKGFVPQLLIAAVFLAIRASVLHVGVTEAFGRASAPGGIAVASPIFSPVEWPVLLFAYAGLWIAPFRLSLFHVLSPARGLTDPRVLAGLAIAVGAVTGAVVVTRADRRSLLGVLWTALGIAPPLLLLPPGGAPIAERYLYLPSVGIAVAIAAVLSNVLRTSSGRLAPPIGPGRRTGAGGESGSALAIRPFPVPVVAASLVVILLSALTFARASAWRDEQALLERTLRSDPAAYPVAVNLGFIERSAGRDGEALALFDRMLALAQTERDPRNSLQRTLSLGRIAFEAGTLYMRRDEPDLAEERFREALRYDPTHEGAALSLGALLALSDRYREAEEVLTRSLRFHPRSEGLARNLAGCRRLASAAGAAGGER
jgi:protein O-mannosyl-transferase